MNFKESVNYLYGLGHEILAMKLGLETIRLLAESCGNPHLEFNAVHIAGTNGKGSTAAFTDSILRAAGIRSGLYTSPHLDSITERIMIGGKGISPDDFARLATLVREKGEGLVSDGALQFLPTFFEQITMIAYLFFAEQGIDLAVLEVGMGGRLDATNICRPVVTAITPVGMDHQQYLGDTLAKIAAEKAGIIKRGVPVVIAPQENDALDVILARARELDAPTIVAGDNCQAALIDNPVIIDRGKYRTTCQNDRFKVDAKLNLRGLHQTTNAVTAIAISQQLIEAGWEISSDAVNSGLRSVAWPGRLEIFRISEDKAPILLDGAHNIDGARALRAFLDDHFHDTPVTLLFGAMADKDVEAMCGVLFPAARIIITTKVSNPRAESSEKLSTLAANSQAEIFRTESVTEAISLGLKITPPTGLLCISGSLYLIGEVKRCFSSDYFIR
jgi:dihydrofolate synthase/folylpolyglutamate synthase